MFTCIDVADTRPQNNSHNQSSVWRRRDEPETRKKGLFNGLPLRLSNLSTARSTHHPSSSSPPSALGWIITAVIYRTVLIHPLTVQRMIYISDFPESRLVDKSHYRIPSFTNTSTPKLKIQIKTRTRMQDPNLPFPPF